METTQRSSGLQLANIPILLKAFSIHTFKTIYVAVSASIDNVCFFKFLLISFHFYRESVKTT